jgi:hypothetical protein
MSRANSRPLSPAPIRRALALTSALGVLCIAGSGVAGPAAAAPQPMQPQPMQPQATQPQAMQPTPAAGRRHGWKWRRESIEQRIVTLHGALKITPDEEPAWSAVAQTMRTNEAAMQKLIADRKMERQGGGVTALDDLKTYERFNRAHLDGVKDLIASFATLYNAMPEAQKVVADHVFQRFGRHKMRSNG